jgi:hypothetical protein
MIPSMSGSELMKVFVDEPEEEKDDFNPLSYFKMANKISDIIFLIIILTVQWRRKAEFLYLMDFLHRSPAYANTRRRHKVPI